MKIAVVGSYGVGLSMRVSVMPGAGETVSGGVFSAGHGGKGSNQAVAAARLGADVALLTAVGADSYGEKAAELWAAEGVDARGVRTVSAQTMAGFIIVEPDGENRIVIAPGALDELSKSDAESFRPFLSNAQMAIVSLEIPLDVALAALRIAHEEGTPTMLNPAPAHRIPVDAWRWVDFVTPNQTELKMLLGVDECDETPVAELAQRLQRLSRATVIVTLGEGGALAVTAESLLKVAPVIATAVDTTGAGDSFTAALAVGLTENMSLAEAAHFAARAGAHTVAGHEVIPALPFRRDLDGA